MDWFKQTGWKMITGFMIIGIGGVLYSLKYQEFGGILVSIGLSLAGIGTASKMERIIQK